MKKVYGSKRLVGIVLIFFVGIIWLVWQEPKELMPWLCLVGISLFMVLAVRSIFVPVFTFDEEGIQTSGIPGLLPKKSFKWDLAEKIDDQFAGKQYLGYIIRMGKTAEFVVPRYSYTNEDIAVLSDIIRKAKAHNPNLAVSPSLLKKAGLSSDFAPSHQPTPNEPEGSQTAAPQVVHPTPVVTFILLGILSLIFILELIFKLDPTGAPLSLGVNSYMVFGGVSRNLVIGHGDWFRLLTAMFLHADPIHILGNGVALYFAGTFLEEYFSRAWFFVLFAFGGLAGTVASISLNSPNVVSIGASGAIMALLAADFVLAFRLPPSAAKTRAQSLSLRILIPSLLPQLSHGGNHVDISAHLGGALAGILIGLFLLTLWKKGENQPPFPGFAQTICLTALVAFLFAGFCEARVYETAQKVLAGNIPDEKSLNAVLDGEMLGHLGVMYQKGTKVNKDDQKAVRLYQMSADQGNGLGERSLGYMYQFGLGVRKDLKKAAALYQKAANHGDEGGEFNLGLMYESGEGVRKDYGQALKWYQAAADSGFSRAQVNLGIMYEIGRGVPKDYAMALAWYRKAADAGDASAQNNIGFMYESGWGVDKDKTQALNWYRKAAAKGEANAKKNLLRLTKSDTN
jgi:membrane associated rhomboid family serine protease